MIDANYEKNGSSLLLKDLGSKSDLLYLFSFYLASNPDFKYNVTYLTDLIQPFLDNSRVYREKIKTFSEIIDYTMKYAAVLYELELTFDERFRFNTHKPNGLEVVPGSEFPSERIMSRKEFSFKLKSQTLGIEYSYLIKQDAAYQNCCAQIDGFIQILQDI